MASTGWEEFACFLLTFALAALSQLISKTISAPFERVKIVEQCDRGGSSSDDDTDVVKKRLFSTSRLIYKQQGCISFWNGNMANCIRAVPKFALDMAIKGEINQALSNLPAFDTDNNYGDQLLVSLISGALAAMVSTILLYPLDLAKTRLAADLSSEPQFDGIIDCWRKVYDAQGFIALYNGLFVCLVGDAIYRGLKYGIYDGFRPLLLELLDGMNEGIIFLVDWLYGWIISAAVGTLVMPIDTVRRVLMSETLKTEQKRATVYSIEEPVAPELITEPRYRGFWHCMRCLVKEHGVTRLWRGNYL